MNSPAASVCTLDGEAARLDHPPYEEIVLLHSGELDSERIPYVEAHLATCIDCAGKHSRLDEMYGMVAGSLPRRVRPGSGFVKKSLAAALSILVALYLLTDGSASAKADELLSRAGAEEMKAMRRRQIMRVQSGGIDCHLVSESGRQSYASHGPARELDCEAISTAVRQSGWEANELLSPQKFQKWRRSISGREDSVEKSDGETRITTKAPAGVLQLASLRIRTSDYRPISAHYEFAAKDGRPRVIDVAEVENLPAMPEPIESRLEQPISPSSRPAVEPLDVADATDRREAQVRLILHEAGAGGNVLLAVDRAGSQIRVWGVAGDGPAKDALARQLEPIQQVTVELVSEKEQQELERPSPWNPRHGDAAPLALKQIDALFPNQPEARQQYLNGLDRLAREIAGATRDREAVHALLRRLGGSPESVPLAGVAAALDKRVVNRLESLREELSPLLPADASATSSATLSAEDGVELYNLVQQVAILASQEDPLSLDGALTRLALLSQRK